MRLPHDYAFLYTGPAVAVLGLVVLSTIVYAWKATYNLCFHPLRKYPGPKSWAITAIPYIRSYVSGQGHRNVHELHQKYGPIVRVAPDELAFCSAEAWEAIMGHRKGSGGENSKDVVFSAGSENNILGANREDHRRFRRILSNGFSSKAMYDQQPLIMRYVDLLFQRLHEHCYNGNKALDLVAWYNYATFDIIGELSFGESFGCLENSDYHPWVSLIFKSIKARSFMTSARLLGPTVNLLLSRLIPERLLRERREYFELVHERVAKRLADGMSRPDFMDTMVRRDDSMFIKMLTCDCAAPHSLAYAEMRLILARMIWNFDFKIAEESKAWIDDNKVYMIWEKLPLKVYLVPREKNGTDE
ncbi:hypothetical protein ACJ41O_000115 [Fusarium nematophilum]